MFKDNSGLVQYPPPARLRHLLHRHDAGNIRGNAMKSTTRSAVLALLFAALGPRASIAQEKLSGDTLQISRISGPIRIDGDLSDEGW